MVSCATTTLPQTMPERVTLVSSEADINRLFTAVQRVDLHEVAAAQRPTTVWKVHFVTNITFYLDKLLGAGLIKDGRVDLPDYIRNNRWAWTRAMGEYLRTTYVFSGVCPCS